MDKKNQVMIAILVAVLVISAGFFVLKSIDLPYPEKAEPPVEKDQIPKQYVETLEVTFWNPWGGPTKGGSYIMMSMPAYYLTDYLQFSIIVVSATVFDSIEWNDSTEEGKAKLEEFDSPWMYPVNKECYFDVNEVFKGNFDIDHIYLKTDVKDPAFQIGEEYVLFIRSENGTSNYQICGYDGYLLKNGSVYEGMSQTIPIKEDELKYLCLFSDADLKRYERMASCSQVFIGEMLTSTNDDDLVYVDNLDSKQQHKARVIGTVKGNLSGTVRFTYQGAYVTEEMMSDYLDQEQVTMASIKYWYSIESNGTGYYRTGFWDPELSPLKAGDIYLICLQESEEEGYLMRASNTDYRIEEHNKKQIQNKAKEYRETLKLIAEYFDRF